MSGPIIGDGEGLFKETVDEFNTQQGRREFAVVFLIGGGLLAFGVAIGVVLLAYQVTPEACGQVSMWMPTDCRGIMEATARSVGRPAALAGGLMTLSGVVLEMRWDVFGQPEVSGDE